LTFFFRYAKPLLDNGYIYIAQPPLYKITVGKTSEYLYDDRALDKMLRERGIKGLTLYDRKKAKISADEALVTLLGNMSNYYNSFNSPLINPIPSVVIRGLIRSEMEITDFDSQETMQTRCDYLNHYLKDHAENYGVVEAKDYKISIKFNAETNKYNLKLELGEEIDPVLITANLIRSTEYQRIKNAYPLIRSFLLEEEKVLILDTGSEELQITAFTELQRIVEERGKKGLTLQRFKGLGEMMPQQLWETTMDPATRTLLRVEIEDAMLADQLFDILMGDKVEPRRDFIESNAIYATNIDT
jgi:DNA gyrase subunit B